MEYAKYIGTAQVRRMLAREWKAAGIEDQGTVTFDAANGYSVPRSAFSDEAWAILVNDPGIVMTGGIPTPDAVSEAAITAAANRLLARQSGKADVRHAQDEVPAAGLM